MKDTVDFNHALADTINRQRRKSGNHQLAGTGLAARPAAVGKVREGIHDFEDAQGNTAGGFRAVSFPDNRKCRGDRGGGFRPSGYASAGIPAVNQLADVFVFDELAPVGGLQALPHFPKKPLIIIH